MGTAIQKCRNIVNSILRWINILCTCLALIIALAIIALEVADRFIVEGFFTAQIINLLIQADLTIEVFSWAKWISDRRIWFILILVVSVCVVVLIKRFFRKELKYSPVRMIRSTVIHAASLAINLLLLFYAVVLIFNFSVSGYVERFFGSLESNETVRYAYEDKIELIKEHLNEKERLAGLKINEMMAFIEEGSIDLATLSDEEYRNIGVAFALLIDQRGGIPTEEEHYFRNRFNRAPETLGDMVKTIMEEHSPFGWYLMAPSVSLFHLQGHEGEYNLKFVSADGYFEAVYNREGALLTAENDPENMGTFNYADPLTAPEKHSLYDVLPYLIWNNTPDALPIGEVGEEKFTGNSDAVSRYEYYDALLKRP